MPEIAESSPLDAFQPAVQGWFRQTFRSPTRPQVEGWPPIQRGDHTLILSPTGSGKTLAAFLWGINQLYTEVHPAATALAASAGFAGGLGRIPFVGLLPKRRNLLAGFVLAALPAAAALLFAWSRFEPNPYGGY